MGRAGRTTSGSHPPLPRPAARDRRGRRLRTAAAGILSLSTLVACGPSTDSVRLSGRVLCDGRPVSEGTVALLRTDGMLSVETPLQPDGGFLFGGNVGLFPGEYVVVVLPPLVRPTSGFDDRSEPELVPAPSPIPDRHRRPATSPLRVELVPGETRREFELTAPPPQEDVEQRSARNPRIVPPRVAALAESDSDALRTHVRTDGLDRGDNNDDNNDECDVVVNSVAGIVVRDTDS